jgi:uncharacterized membrane protein
MPSEATPTDTRGGAGGGRSLGVGGAAFAVALIGIGIQGLVKRDFGPVWGPVPEAAPARVPFIYLWALVELACGAGLLLRRTAAAAARALLAFSLLWFLAVRVTYFVFVSHDIDGWYPVFQVFVMIAAAWVLYVRFATGTDRRRFAFAAGDGGLRVARALYGVALIPFGIAHFLYLEATAPLVPGWLPWHVGWAYFTGAAFIAAGVAILVRVWGRLAAVLSVWQMGLFALLVWLPKAMAGTLSDFQKGEFVATLVLAAAAWVVAESYRDISWLETRRRP